MKIVIFGASGKTGRQLLEMALKQNHSVTAFVRNPSSLSDLHNSNLTVLQGDILDATSVEQAVENQDVVLLAVGVPPNVKEPVLSTGTKHILQAMEKHGVKRIIVESGIGVGETISRAHLTKKLMISTILKRVYADKALQEQYVKESNRDWTILHAADLTNGPFTGTYRMGEDLKLGIKASISRSDVADCMLKLLTDSSSYHKSFTLAY